MQTALRTLARRVGAFAADFHESQRRVVELQTSPDRYVLRSNGAPDSYEEFLFRTSEPLMHEPSAAVRAGS
jgi:hypothetical protein